MNRILYIFALQRQFNTFLISLFVKTLFGKERKWILYERELNTLWYE